MRKVQTVRKRYGFGLRKNIPGLHKTVRKRYGFKNGWDMQGKIDHIQLFVKVGSYFVQSRVQTDWINLKQYGANIFYHHLQNIHLIPVILSIVVVYRSFKHRLSQLSWQHMTDVSCTHMNLDAGALLKSTTISCSILLQIFVILEKWKVPITQLDLSW